MALAVKVIGKTFESVHTHERTSVCALNLIIQRGYNFKGDHRGINFFDKSGNTVLQAFWRNGMPRCRLSEIFNLVRLDNVEVNLSEMAQIL